MFNTKAMQKLKLSEKFLTFSPRALEMLNSLAHRERGSRIIDVLAIFF